MTDTTLPPPRPALSALIKPWRVGLTGLALLAALVALSPALGQETARFVLAAFASVGPFLLVSAALAAYAAASGADAVIARAFTGSPARMIVLAALFGALSPFCSCGVIPLIAALLAMGVPLAPVMAFWLASPIMSPEMFVLTWGILGPEFALAKTAAAIGLGLLGGGVTQALTARLGPEVLREGAGGGSCSARAKARGKAPVAWAFWEDAARRQTFWRDLWRTLRFLGQWLFLAFLLESLMLALVPAEAIATHLGGSGPGPILLATLVGVPAYLNGYAALPLVSGLMTQGLQPGAAMAFLVAGGVTSIPAAMAVWALVRPQVFALYLGLALVGAFLAGLGFALV
jgi:uncharacterized membrane protein YraQ (UPF0718 family)